MKLTKFIPALSVCALATHSAHAAILANPLIIGSYTAYNGSYLATNVLDSNQSTEYASQGGGNRVGGRF